MADDTQEPFVAIVARNSDKVSGLRLIRGTVAGRRSGRWLIAFAASLIGGVVLIGFVVVVQSLMAFLGVE